jgi:predicted Zn-dependent protease
LKNLAALLWVACLAAAAFAQSPGKSASAADVRGALSEMDRLFETPDEPLSPEDEYYLGRTVAAQILRTYGAYTEDPGMVRYLNLICLALVINSPNPGAPNFGAFNGCHVGMLDSPVINAFATPGGHIFLTRGLVECADSEDALAAVVAHELAHIQLRHAAAIIDDQRLVQDLSLSAGRAASAASGNARARKQALFNRHISDMVYTLFKNGFSQAQEFEADLRAVTLLRNAGYDPAALGRMLAILEKIQPLRPGGFNTTHPLPADRLANLSRVSLIGAGGGTRAYRASRFAFFHSRIREAP